MFTRAQIILTLVLTLSVFLLSFVVGQLFFTGMAWTHQPLHISLEITCGMLAFLIAYVLSQLDEAARKGTHFSSEMVSFFLAVGILNAFHASFDIHPASASLHSLLILFRGVLFGMVLLPATFRQFVSWKFSVPLAVFLGSLSFLSYDFSAHDNLAPTFLFVAGILLFAAGARLVLSYIQYQNHLDLLFSLPALLGGCSTIFRSQVEPWSVTWWTWRILRLVAYTIILYNLIKAELASRQVRTEMLKKGMLEKGKILESVIENMGEGIVVLSKEGHPVLVNTEVERLLGKIIPDMDFAGWGDYYGFYYEDRKTIVPYDQWPLVKALRGEIVRRKTYFVRNASIPTGRFLSIHGGPIVNGFEGGVVLFHDITEEIRQEATFGALVNETPIGKLIFAQQGKIILVNRAVLQMVGVKEEKDVLRLKIEDFFAQHNGQHILNEYLLQQDPQVITRDLMLSHKDGRQVPVEIKLVPITTVDEGTTLVVISDITARKDLEDEMRKQHDELKRSNYDLEQFAYVASHDLQAPLRHIQSYVERLLRYLDIKNDEKAERWANFITKATSKMRSLINDLLEFSRVGRNEGHMTAVTLSPLVLEIRDSFAFFKEHPSAFTISSLPIVYAHPHHMMQVFQNLIENAIKYRSPERPLKVKLQCTEKDTYWEFRITDNGLGIPNDSKERIFKVFQRLAAAKEIEGTGIGLSICQKIIQLHGGHIWVEDNKPHGSIFVFTISKALNHNKT